MDSKPSGASLTLCIYCGKPGPFSDEHVVSAAFGGDDKRWMLKNLVCRVCNTKVFSPMEAKVARSSQLALARIFLQSRGRKAGKDSNPPRLEVTTVQFVDPESNLALEAEIHSKGLPVVLPQILVAGVDSIAFTGGAKEEADAFLAALPALLANQVLLIRKHKATGAAFYGVTPLLWTGAAYDLGVESQVAKAPSTGVWCEGLPRPETLDASSKVYPRLYRRSGGQFVIRIANDEHAAKLLTAIRLDLGVLSGVNTSARTTTPSPGMHLRIGLDLPTYYRVIAKIGVNLSAKLLGENVVRHPAFDGTKSAILTGNPRVGRGNSALRWVLGAESCAVSADEHFMKLAVVPLPRSRLLIFVVRFYRGPVECVFLAELPPRLVKARKHVVLVNFNQHQITEYTTLGLLAHAIRERISST